MATTDHSHSPHGGAHGHGSHHGVVLNHETTDVSLNGVTRIAILSFVVIFIILGVVFGFWKAMQSFANDTTPLPALSGRTIGKDRLPTGPLVITDEPGALRQLRAEEKQILEHYGWVNKDQGIVRLPIERAMDLLAEQPQRINPGGAAPAAPAVEGAAPAATPPATPPPAAGHE